ncbi:sigma factor G inhibitor Gin [Clostridium sp.]|uniref:sigma factor G inhibitor Gin n=1 Tax=Clostridium sp. TaxID=1506 RepID=UPI002851774B|nr:sigma factor G inhibitor Gin [Clostridium sp.]MDR3594304.1 sigma factor G inhibitor Gin [Clostridium sp.]
MEISNNACFMCGESNCDGIILNGEKICKSCEERIVNTSVNDLDYNMYKDEIKILLFNEHAKK